MVLKRDAQAVVKKYLKVLIPLLKLTEHKINIHIYHSKSKYLQSKGIPEGNDMGLCFSGTLGSDIIIFYDKHPNVEELLGTLFHELLHARLSKLTNLITMFSDQANDIEEEIVADLERIFRVIMVAKRGLKIL